MPGLATTVEVDDIPFDPRDDGEDGDRAADEAETRQCNKCGEAWDDTGADECPFCGSTDTVIVEHRNDSDFGPTFADQAENDEPDDHADAAFEFGQAFEDALVELYHLALHQAEEYQDDKAALKAMQMGIKYNPRHILRAAKLFPEVFAHGGGANSTDLFAAFTICAKCKDDTDALAAHEWYMMHGPMLDGLKVYLKEHYGTERGKAPTLAERCAELVRKWTEPSRYLNNDVPKVALLDADDLAALREVKRVLERKEIDDKVPTLAEQCTALVQEWRARDSGLMNEYADAHDYSDAADELAALPEVAKVLERKDSDGKAE